MARTSGEVVISTRVNTTQAEKDLAELEDELEKFNDKGKKLLKQKADLDIKKENIEKANKELQKYNDYLEKTKAKLGNLKSKDANFYDYQNLSKTEDLVKYLEGEVAKYKDNLAKANQEYEKTIPKLDNINKQIKDNARNQNEVKQKIEETNKKINQNRLKEVQKQLSNIKSSTDNVVRKILKWGLALFSIRSAYNFIRGAVSTLSQSNEQIGADIEYIRWALASTLQPIIETIIKLAYTLLQYINYIANAWFGVNLFAKATADNFKKSKDNIKGANAEAKKLQKTMAGFDEMNVLQENGSTSTGGGGGGIALPSTDLSQMLPDVEIPGWVEFIATHKDEIIEGLIGIAQAFSLWKVLTWVNHLNLFAEGITTLSRVLQGAGIALIIIGIWNAVSDLINLIAEPSWDNFLKLIGDLSLALTGLGLVLVGINASNPFGWATIAIGVVGSLVGAIFGATKAEEEHETTLNDVKEATLKLNGAQERLQESYDTYYNVAKRAEKAEKDLKELEEKHNISAKLLFQEYSLGIKSINNMTDAEKEVFYAYMANEQAQKDLFQANEDVLSIQGEIIDSTGELSGALFQNTKQLDDNFRAMVEGYKKGEISVHDANVYLTNMMAQMDKTTKEVFRESIPDSLAYAFDNNSFNEFYDETINGIKNIKTQTATTFFNEIPNSLTISNKALDNFNYRLSTAYNLIRKFPGINIKATYIPSGSYGDAKGGIVTKLATGGIVNRPGRGVPIVGEAGREAVLPLGDSQVLSEIADAIGKKIVLQPTIPVYVGNRMIAREIRTINNESDFAFNR